MNEQAFDDLYQEFVETGYRGSKDAFKELMSTNPDAFLDGYQSFTETGYNGSQSDFAELLGVVDPTVKKKDQSEQGSMGSSSADGSSELPVFDAETFDFSQIPSPDNPLGGIVPQDTRQDGYVFPTRAIGMYPDQYQIDRANAQEAADFAYTNQLIEQEKADPVYKNTVEQEEQKRRQEKAEAEAAAIGMRQDEDFQTALNTIDANLIDQEEEEVVPFLQSQFSKFGFTFEETGMGDALIAFSPDGSSQVEIDLDPFTSATEVAESQKLRNFINNNVTGLKETQPADEITNAMKVRNSRSMGRTNPDGSVSTVKMMSFEADGKFYAAPTLFPKDPNEYGADPIWWQELEGDEAIDLAFERGEVYEFETAEEAEAFADGSWKDVSTADAEAQNFYRKRGRNYARDRKIFDDYTEARDIVNFIQEAPFRNNDLTPDEKEKYSALYINGKLRNDLYEVEQEYQAVVDNLIDDYLNDDAETVREDFDVYMHKQHQKQIYTAIGQNEEAKAAVDEVDKQSLLIFGVNAKDLLKVQPKNETEVAMIDKLYSSYNQLSAVKEAAAQQYERANLFYNLKHDKNVRKDYSDNWEGFTSEIQNGWNRGKAGDIILMYSMYPELLGGYDPDDPDASKNAAAKIVEYMSSESNTQSRVLSRWQKAQGFDEAWDVVADNPMEWMLTLAGQSLSMMLPYGWKIIGASTAVGAGTGAVTGSVVPGVGTAAGGVTGATWGFRTGFAATSLAMEYTNEVLDAAAHYGYDIMNPESMAQAMEDQRVWDRGAERGLKRGIPIATIDMLTAGLAGRVFKAGSVASKPARVAALTTERVIVDPAAEAFGELAAQVNVGDKVDWKEIAAEAGGGLGNNSSNMAINLARETRFTNNIELASNLSNLNFMSQEVSSNAAIAEWGNNMERLGQISPEENQRIQENVGIRKEAQDLLNTGQRGRRFRGKNAIELESRLMHLLAAKSEFESSTNRKAVFGQKISEINAEIAHIIENKEMLPPEQQTLLAGAGVYGVNEQASGSDVRSGMPSYRIKKGRKTVQVSKEEFLKYINGLDKTKLLKFNGTIDNDEEVVKILETKIKEAENALQKPSTKTVDAQTSTEGGTEVGEGVPGAGTITEQVATETVTPESEVSLEEVTPELTPETTTEEVSSKTLQDQEVEDLKTLFDNDADPQFQLDSRETTPEKKAELVQSATKLMEQVQPEVESESVVVETPVKTYPVTVTENTELANKVGKMGLKDLVGKRVNFVMADQLKVDDKRMGGPFFPLQDGLFGEVAWASISQSAAESIAKGAVNADYSVVYNMSPSAVDSNLVLLDTLIDKVKESPNREQLFNAMMADIQGKVYGNKTDFVHKIAAESRNIDEFAEGFAQLDVDTKAKIFRDVLPSQNVEAATEVGRLFQAEGVTQESVRQENVEQFVSDLPMGAMTMVLQVTDKNGNPVTNETYKEAVITPQEQKERGLKEHRNYPFYLRGKAVAMMEETAPFWTVSKRHRGTIDGKVAGVITDNKDKKYTAGQARSAEMRRASMQSSRTDLVTEPTATMYEQFINRLSKAFPGVEVMTDQEAFNELVNDLNAKKLATKNQKIYGAVYQGKLYLNPALENYNTPVHEFGHIWLNVAKEMNPEAYQRGLELVADSDYVSQIENNKEYQRVIKQMKKDGMSEEDIRNYILEEALATAIGDKGESFATAAQKRNFKNWLNDLFNFVKKLVGISGLTTEQLQDLTLDKFTEAVVVDLMSENKAFQKAEAQALSNELQLMTSAPNPSIGSLVQKARENGFSDDAIRVVLKEKGFKAKDINAAMKVQIDLLTPMPREFGNVEGGSNVGVDLFNRVREKVNRFATAGPRGGRGTTRTKTFSEIRAKAQEILQADPTYQAQPEQLQLELRSALDRSLGIRSNPQVRQEIGNIRQRLRERRGAIKNITDAQRQMRMFIRKALPKSKNYSNAAINKLLKVINNTTPNNFDGQVEVVLNQVEKQRQILKNQLIDKIQKLVEKKAKTAQTSAKRRRSAGLDAIGQAYFAEVKKVLKMVKANDVAGLTAMQQEINEEALTNALAKMENGEKLTRQERALIDKQLALDTFADVMSMELEEVSQLFDEVKKTRAESIARLNNRREARREAVNQIKSEFDEQIENDYSELYDEDGGLKNDNQLRRDNESIMESFRDKGILAGVTTLFEKAKRNNKYTANGIQKFLRNTVTHLGTIANTLDRGKKGLFTKVFYERLNEMDERNLQGVFRQEEKLNSVSQSVLGKNWRKWKYSMGTDTITLKGIKNSKTGAAYTEALNKDQAMRIYALSLNPIQRQKLEAQGFDDAAMSRIENFIGSEGVSIAEQIVDYFSNEYYNEVNDVFVQANDVNLGYVENYFPTRTISSNPVVADMVNGEFSKIFTADTAPALQERTDTTSDVEIGASFTEVVEEHIKSMERYKAYALGVKEMNEVYKSPAIQTLLKETGIGPIFKQMLNYAINPDSGPRPSDGVMSWIQRNFTGFALAFKPIQVLKQATSFVQAYEDYSFLKNQKVPGLDLLAFVADYAYVLATLPKQVREAKEISATFKNRIARGLEGDVFGLESGGRTYKKLKAQQGRKGAIKRGFDRAAGFFTVAGDIAGVLGYKALYNRAIANGMSETEALALFNKYNETQQTRRSTEKVALQQDTNFASKFFTMFGSTLFLQMNKAFQSSNNIVKSMADGKRPALKDFRALALNVSVANVLFTMASYSGALLKGDKEDKDRAWRAVRDAALGLNLLYQIPLAGAGMEYAINKMRGERRPTSEGVNPFVSVGRKIEKAFKDTSDGEIVKAVKPIFEIIIGAQFDSPIGLFNIMGGSTDDADFYDALGITPSYRPGYGDNKKSNSSKKKKPMTRTRMKEELPDLYNDLYGPGSVDAEIKQMKRELKKELSE